MTMRNVSEILRRASVRFRWSRRRFAVAEVVCVVLLAMTLSWGADRLVNPVRVRDVDAKVGQLTRRVEKLEERLRPVFRAPCQAQSTTEAAECVGNAVP